MTTRPKPLACVFALVLALLVAIGGFISVGQAAEPQKTTDKPAAAENKPYEVLQEQPNRLIVQLPNRLIVVAQELPTAPVVSAHVWVKTGSIYEQEFAGYGLSHYLEHLVSGGTTKTRTEADNNAILGQIGAQTNAATSLETVRYYINTTSPYTEQAIDLLSDWLQHSEIGDAEVAREHDVIQREFDMGQGEPGRIFWKLTQQARYQHHPARHPTIGYIDRFLATTGDQLRAYYKRMYVPNNMVFVVVGDIDKQKVVQQIANLWADSDARDVPEIELPVEPEIESPRHVEGIADIQRPRLRLAWPGTMLAAEGDYALDLLSGVLGGGESSRLVQNIRDQKRLVNTIDAYNFSANWGKGFFGVDAEVVVPDGVEPQAAIDNVKAAILEEINRVQKEGVTEEELARVKRQTLARSVYGDQTASAVASRLASDLITMGDPDYHDKYVQAIQSITPQEVQAAAERFLKDQRLMTVVLKPAPEGEKPPLMTSEGMLDVPADVQTQTVRLDNAVLAEDLEASLADAAGKARSIEIDPIETFTLDNGLRVLVQRSTLVPAVSMQFYHLGGLLGEKPGREGIASAATNMLMKGTENRTALEIAQTLESLGAQMDTSSGNNTFYAQAQSLDTDWKTVLGLMSEVLLQPSFPDDEWQRLQPRLLAAIDRQDESWWGELSQNFRQTYFGEHPWSQTPLGRREVVADLKAEDLAKFYRSHLGADQSVLAVFGDVDPQEVKAEVEKLFADLPAKAEVPFSPPAAVTSVQPTVKQVQIDKPLAAAEIGFGPGPALTSPDLPAVTVLSNLMSSFPTGWLEQQLRGRGPGLVYAVGAGNVTGLQPGFFAIYFNTGPEQAPEAISRSMSVVNRAREELADDASLARAKASTLTGEFMSKQSNSSRATAAALDVLYGLGLDHDKWFLEKVQELDAEAVRDVARKYLSSEPVLVVISGDPAPEDALHKAVNGELEAKGEPEGETNAQGEADAQGEAKARDEADAKAEPVTP